ncbi:MAG: LytTR family transcriptional regulator DNA-binding domain-containing protein [Prevotella sp.]|nr:LytTR family transcriptional regulator DNA-binding domain-containing protein [Prevotella sp.]
MLICNNIDFIRINKHVIINTKFFRQLNKGREIVMKNGTIFKVSRRCVSLFK